MTRAPALDTMPLFTPGPWVADRVHPEWPECLVRYVGAQSGYFDDICTLYGGESNDENRRRIEADARLIAAAPDLLRELKALAELAHNSYTIPDSVWEAIAKAEGK